MKKYIFMVFALIFSCSQEFQQSGIAAGPDDETPEIPPVTLDDPPALALGPPTFVHSAEFVISASTLGIIYNETDEESVELASYYQNARKISVDNMIAVSFDKTKETMTESEFQELFTQIDAATKSHIRAYAVAWIAPFRVNCMSITSAIALKGDFEKYCIKSSSNFPVTVDSYDLNQENQEEALASIRPAMMIHAGTLEDSKKMIDKGLLATNFKTNLINSEVAGAYFNYTADSVRSGPRASQMAALQTLEKFNNGVDVHFSDYRNGDPQYLTDKKNVLFYLTGRAVVNSIDQNEYLPGAVADHLTSYGGRVLGANSQMPITEWIKAGVTGSYGTVVEPLAYSQKFPNAEILVQNYLTGMPLLQAYWSSVKAPAEGLFMGDPLAKPFAGVEAIVDQANNTIDISGIVQEENINIMESSSLEGPYNYVKTINIPKLDVYEIKIENAKNDHFYKLEKRKEIAEYISSFNALNSTIGSILPSNLTNIDENGVVKLNSHFPSIDMIKLTLPLEGCENDVQIKSSLGSLGASCLNCDDLGQRTKEYLLTEIIPNNSKLDITLGCIKDRSFKIELNLLFGDITNDQVVDEADENIFNLVLYNSNYAPIIDYNLDGEISQADIDIMKNYFTE